MKHGKSMILTMILLSFAGFAQADSGRPPKKPRVTLDNKFQGAGYAVNYSPASKTLTVSDSSGKTVYSFTNVTNSLPVNDPQAVRIGSLAAVALRGANGMKLPELYGHLIS